MKLLLSVFFCFTVLLFFPVADGFAHKVVLFAWVEDGIIHTESSFGGKRYIKKGKIFVYDETGQMIHAGVTDDMGKHSFEIPENTDSDLLLKLDASTGHHAKWKILKTELIHTKNPGNIKQVMEKETLSRKSPTILKILLGIGILFGLALVLKFIKRESLKPND